MTEQVAHPPIASAEQWRAERLRHLEHEKELTRQHDRVREERRRLPMVRVDKEYIFEGPNGKRGLVDLFEGQRQLVVYHFMFDPKWESGCDGCSGYVDAIGNVSMLGDRNTTFALISRAPFAKLDAYKKARGWTLPWWSSFGSDFNQDYQVTLDAQHREYNYRERPDIDGEEHGVSVFFRLGGDVYHTYSSYARGTEALTDCYSLLDVTPYGRQEDWEASPPGWPQRPTYG